MNELGTKKADIKAGTEKLTIHGQEQKQSLLDFWRWSTSDLLSNAIRGKFAEFIVASALEMDLVEARNEWDAYDILTPEGIKVEVKSAAYIQSWEQTKKSIISFSIKPALKWDTDVNKRESHPKRHADYYVFCLLKHEEQATINPLELEQWEFYVVDSKTLDDRFKNQKSISLGPLKTISIPMKDHQIKSQIKVGNGKEI